MRYFEPLTVEEAALLLQKYGEEAKLIAGGTDLVPQMKKKLKTPQFIVDLESISGLDCINFDEQQGLKIGALTTIRALEKSTLLHQRYPVISEACSYLGSVAIRNMATLGGNICNAAPSADTAPALIGYSAKVRLFGPNGERTVLLQDFFTGPGSTILEEEEILVDIQVPVPKNNTHGIYLKHRKKECDLAIVGVAIIIITDSHTNLCKDVKIVLGAVAPTPLRAYSAEELLKGKKITEQLIDQVAGVASDESCPISDIRASAKYRRAMIKVFTANALKHIFKI